MKTLWLLALSLLLATAASAQRGRPAISNGTFVADNGQLLRGSTWSTDFRNGGLPCAITAPSCPMISAIKTRGLNALHLYGAMKGQNPRDPNLVASIDRMVEWTAQEGLYLILTIGGAADGVTTNTAFEEDFWNFYAEKYKDRAHVLYEIKNEPFADIPPSTTGINGMINYQRKLYHLIRGKAPATPILVFSYPWFQNGPGVVQDIDALSSTAGGLVPVDWSNAGIAFHGYSGFAETTAAVNHVRANRPHVALFQTEFYLESPARQDPKQTQFYEDKHISWLTFVAIDFISDTNFKHILDAENVVWVSDFPTGAGTWPAWSNPPATGRVALRAQNGKYVTVNAVSGALTATAASPATNAEKFTVHFASGGYYVGLKSVLNGKFVEADANNGYRVGAFRTFVGRIEWMTRPSGAVALRMLINGQVVSANQLAADAHLVAARVETAGGAEFSDFTVEIVP